MKLNLAALLVVFSFCQGTLTGEEEPLNLGELNDAIAFLAGIEFPHQADHHLAGGSSWATHRSRLDEEFTSHQERVLFPMTAWSNTELPKATVDGSVVRYLFSGPDILHAYHMFPSADLFLLCGLEPVGEIPDLSELNVTNAGRALSEVRNALGEIINFSFFRTKDMKDDLQFATFRGTTPIMMIFLARSGQYIKGVEFFELKSDGTLASTGRESKGADAVKIEFGPQRLQQSRTLYYFCSDLSDSGFDTTGFETWLEAQPKGNSYLKAASFLMHQNWFKKVRGHLLEYSNQIVQDDSGIPFHYFDADTWYVDLFGTYTGPIDLFAEYYQGGLRAAYRTRKKELDFGTGYKWRKGESNLMRFIKQDVADGLTKEEEGSGSAEVPPTEATPATSETKPEAAVPEAAAPAGQ